MDQLHAMPHCCGYSCKRSPDIANIFFFPILGTFLRHYLWESIYEFYFLNQMIEMHFLIKVLLVLDKTKNVCANQPFPCPRSYLASPWGHTGTRPPLNGPAPALSPAVAPTPQRTAGVPSTTAHEFVSAEEKGDAANGDRLQLCCPLSILSNSAQLQIIISLFEKKQVIWMLFHPRK